MADKKKMSVEDILAACRGADSGGTSEPAQPASKPSKPAKSPEKNVEGTAAEPATPAPAADAGTPPEPPEPKKSPPKPAAAGGAKPGAGMSVADILAAARGQGAPAAPKPAAAASKGAANKPAATKLPAEKSAAEPARAKGAAAKPAAAQATGPLDTSSILAAARGASKPGPISKAEAAAKTKEKGAAPEAPRRMAPPMPAKPEYAVPKPPRESASVERRGFFNILFGSFLAIGFTATALTGTLWTLGLARFMFPNILIEPPSRFKVGFPSDFAPSTVETKFTAQFGVWIVNAEYDGQLQIVALRTVCTHLGCTPNWLEAEQKFKCPCHGSGFYKDGINFEGPAPRPLERYSIRLADDGQLEIDKSRTFQQELGQWSDPASFVPV
jgi:cytochrome b6-f complex iron-sulfur subunit